jgi:hypothetical protein
MSYRIIVAACLFPAIACAGPAAVGGTSGLAVASGSQGFSVAGNGAAVSVLNSPTGGFTINGHMPGGSQSISVGPGPGSASATASSLGTFSAMSSTAAQVVSTPSGTVSGAFGVGTNSSANSNAGN